MDYGSKYLLDSARSRLTHPTTTNEEILFSLIETLYGDVSALRSDLSKAERRIEDLSSHTDRHSYCG